MKNNKIPKIIHQIWIGGEMPDILKHIGRFIMSIKNITTELYCVI